MKNSKLDIALKIEALGLTAGSIEEVRSAFFTNDYDLLNSSLFQECNIIEKLGFSIDRTDLRLLSRIAQEFNL
jgi:hypothetical protein